jgi:catechol 2,3-dioxygenase-like lactoylglutathione lyase family enzyme
MWLRFAAGVAIGLVLGWVPPEVIGWLRDAPARLRRSSDGFSPSADTIAPTLRQGLRNWPGFSRTSNRFTEDSMSTASSSDLRLGPLGQVSLLCRSATATEQWYRDVLGLAHVFTFGDLVFFDCGGVRLFLRQVAEGEWRPGSIIYFLVPDIHAAHEQLAARGVPFGGAPHMIYRDDATGTEEWMAFFEDPDGNTLAIMARVSE